MPTPPSRAGIIAATLAATALQGCSGGLEQINILRQIDGPYSGPDREQQAALARAEPIDLTPAARAAPPAAPPPERNAPNLVPVAAAPEPAAEPAPSAQEQAQLRAAMRPERDPAFIGPVLGAEELEVAPINSSAQQLSIGRGAVEVEPPAAADTGEDAVELATVAESFADLAAPIAEEPPASLVDDGFLPAAEVEAPAVASPVQEDASPPAALAASPERRAAPAPPLLIGPVLGEDRPVALATDLPSAFDFVAEDGAEEPALAAPSPEMPPPAAEPQGDLQREAQQLGLSVVGAMPDPGASPARQSGSGGADAYRPFFDWAMQKLTVSPAGGGRESMLLLDPPSLDPALQTCGNRPPAVLVDLDPANGLLPLVGSSAPNPALAGYLDTLRQRGVTVYWISGHGPNAASRIRQRLTESALDPTGEDPLIVTRFAGESKQERRYALGESHCLLAIMGDHRADFDELYDFVLDPVMASPLEELVGQGWFLAPPPID